MLLLKKWRGRDSLPDRHIKYFLTTQALFAEHKYFLFYAQQKCCDYIATALNILFLVIFDRTHRWEQQDITDRRRICQQHH